ncbi:hypothetical protein ALI144C_31875 [Actinosynnema sp. ALI-1.44]|uniref:hypothetical protein n=1 Tax=Actinosynnema sp. ALI-1.44 TaxID=1933779 RepID=UPI00097CBAE1|nr:hypothetical protein [Actinosynnema sp. ALI-1.44]ONI77994.1 hypothetical protein ALI144C_31875 [Actinosynnema sp. ALI-1.44]
MRNCLGREITDTEAELVAAYEAVRRLADERIGELAPYQARNVLKALSCLWQVMNGLDMQPGHLYEVGA